MQDLGGHRPQCPCARGGTFSKQEQAQGVALGQKQIRTACGANSSRRMTKREGKGSPTRLRSGQAASRNYLHLHLHLHRRRHTKQERCNKTTQCTFMRQGGRRPRVAA